MHTTLTTGALLARSRYRGRSGFSFHYWGGQITFWGVVMLLVIAAALIIWWQVHKRRG
ncbi:hypothetical protein [Actinacidiphila sp. bgisy160]|uniref:hypothetical protein n=1 Tax=Actinacidiphila sp. bgisy160 TaxID=3413796 RepID=UPI003D74B11F